jgi:hypothetical protein
MRRIGRHEIYEAHNTTLFLYVALISVWIYCNPESRNFFLRAEYLLESELSGAQFQGVAVESCVGTQGGVAFILAHITEGGPPTTIMPAINQIAGMLCGVGILICVCFVCGPARGRAKEEAVP